MSKPVDTEIYFLPDGSVAANMLPPDLEEIFFDCSPRRSVSPRYLNLAMRHASSPSPIIDLEEYRACHLCPHSCGWDRTVKAHPRCGGTAPLIAYTGLSCSEEHYLCTHAGSGLILLGGCPLHCRSCIDQDHMRQAWPSTIRDLATQAWHLRDLGAGTLQILSPTAHMPAVRNALGNISSEGFDIPIALKSSGYECPEVIRSMTGLVDIWIPDFKYGPNSDAAREAGVPNYYEVASIAINEMILQVGDAHTASDGTLLRGVVVRHVAAPSPAQEALAIRDFLASLPSGVITSTKLPFIDV